MHPTVGTPLDYFLIVAYFVVVLLFGSYFGRYVRSTKDFFFSGQKLSWWLIGMSCVATTVGSYSFIKYSEAAYRYGFSSTQSYLNDWFWMSLWMFGWLPIIYFSRIVSIPEYLERRFNRATRNAATLILLLYLIGYVGINLLTLGVALHKLLGMDIFQAAVVVAIITAIYVTFGGQTSVIMTDLLQGFLLLVAGFVLFGLGLHAIGGLRVLLDNLPPQMKTAFAPFNKPPEFSFVGIFWQDGMANTAAFYFMHQGMILRFLSAKSVQEGRKAAAFVILLLMPLAAVAVANVGWVGRAMVNLGMLNPNISSRDVFVVVSDMVCRPGVFGLIMAALVAAMMSTVDTLVNAAAVIGVNDIYRPYIRKGASDRHYLVVARVVSVVAAVLGLSLVPVFNSFKTIYSAHAAFTAAITPPLVVTILLGAFWKRYTAAGALWTLLGGITLIFLSIRFPQLVKPVGHGITQVEGLSYMRALYGLLVSTIIGVGVSLVTKPRPLSEVTGLVIGTLRQAREMFKGGPINEEEGEKVHLRVVPMEDQAEDDRRVVLAPEDMARLKARAGDLLYIRDRRWWTGGLRSAHVIAAEPEGHAGEIRVSAALLKAQNLDGSGIVLVEKIL